MQGPMSESDTSSSVKFVYLVQFNLFIIHNCLRSHCGVIDDSLAL